MMNDIDDIDYQERLRIYAAQLGRDDASGLTEAERDVFWQSANAPDDPIEAALYRNLDRQRIIDSEVKSYWRPEGFSEEYIAVIRKLRFEGYGREDIKRIDEEIRPYFLGETHFIPMGMGPDHIDLFKGISDPHDYRAGCCFYCSDKLWHVGPENRTQTYQEQLGFEYLKRSLSKPTTRLPSTDLYWDVVPPHPDSLSGLSLKQMGESEAASMDLDGKKLTYEDGEPDSKITKQNLRRLLQLKIFLEEQAETLRAVDCPDEKEIDKILGRIEKLEPYIKSGKGLRGAARALLNSDKEKCRAKVTKAVRNTTRKIRGQQPELAAYLEQYVNLGQDILYLPPTRPISFIFSPTCTE